MPAHTAGISYPSSIVNSSSTDIPRYCDILRANSKEAFLSPLSIRPIVRPQEPIAVAKSSWQMLRSVLTCFKVVDIANVIPPFE